MKFKQNPDVISVVETTVVEITNETPEEVKSEQETKKKPKLENALEELFTKLQQNCRVYVYCQSYFNKNHCCNSVDFFNYLEAETKVQLRYLSKIMDTNGVNNLPEMSFNFKDDSEFFALAIKLEDELMSCFNKIDDLSNEDVVTKFWFRNFPIFNKYYEVKRVGELMRNGFCDSKLPSSCGIC